MVVDMPRATKTTNRGRCSSCNGVVAFRGKKTGKRLKEGHPWDFDLIADVFFLKIRKQAEAARDER